MRHASVTLVWMAADHDRDDVPSRIDLCDPAQAASWVIDAETRRRWRPEVRRAIAELIRDAFVQPRILELGPGPGLLAETILGTTPVASYTLLDVSAPMLAMARQRLGMRDDVRFVHGSFKQTGWPSLVDDGHGFDVVVAMQAVHEIRHKRHVPGLYREVLGVLQPGGRLVVLDHEPVDTGAFQTTLHSTRDEQQAAMTSAGFVAITTHVAHSNMYLMTAMRP